MSDRYRVIKRDQNIFELLQKIDNRQEEKIILWNLMIKYSNLNPIIKSMTIYFVL